MSGVISGCVTLFVSGGIDDTIKLREVIQESASVNLDIDLAPQENISESSTVVVT